MLSSRAGLFVSVAFALVACGGEPPPPPAPPTPPPPKVEAPEPPPTAEPSAAASAAPAAKPQSSGRPPVVFTDPAQVSDTFGSSPGAKIEIGTDKERAVFRIPENTLHQGYNILFKLEKTARGTAGQVGKVYHIIPNAPPDPKPVRIENTEIPFQIEMTTGGKNEVNLAIGVTDDKGKIAWQIVAPKHVDAGAGIAFFDVPVFTDMMVHLTTKAPAK
ncbi:MAG TPA: hypothetical protein VGM56_12800 [Byssovorax sp.]|jgi:hypothetical protein